MERVGSRSSRFRTDQRDVAKIAGGQFFGDQTFPRNSGVSFPGSSFVHFAQSKRYALCKYTKCSIYVKCC